jgi:hypothetical protein
MSINWEEILSRYPEITGIHPAADIFPMMEGDDFQDLCADIKERGLQQLITIWTDGTLLDGRNRLLACYQTDQAVVLDRYEGDNPLQYSLSANLHRRHLNIGQRAMVALRVEEIESEAAKERQRTAGLEHGRGASEKVVANLPQPIPAPKARDVAAQTLNVSPRSVQMAKAVDKAAPDLADKVRAGAIPLHKAYRETQERQLSQPLPEEAKWSEDEMKRRRIVEAGGTVVANMHSGKDEYLLRWARSTDRFVRIDRQSVFGNPYEIPGDGERDQVCDSFELYFSRKFSLHSQTPVIKGKVLGCWCYPERCHGDHLISFVLGKGGKVDDF